MEIDCGMNQLRQRAINGKQSPDSIQVQITTEFIEKTWKIAWQVNVDKGIEIDPNQLGVSEFPYKGIEFKTNSIPMKQTDWLETPLAAFLGKLCKQLQKIDKPIPLTVNDHHRTETFKGPQIIQWGRSIVNLKEEHNVPLNSIVVLICHKSHYEKIQHFHKNMEIGKSCILLPYISNISSGISITDMKNICTPFKFCDKLPLEYKPLLEELDEELFEFENSDIYYQCQHKINEFLDIVKCDELDSIRRYFSNDYSLVGITPIFKSNKLLVYKDHLETLELEENILSLLINKDTKVFFMFPNCDKENKKIRDAFWLDWPRKVLFKPDTFISADIGLTLDKCYFLFGFFVRFLWLSGRSILDALLWLRRNKNTRELATHLFISSYEPFNPSINIVPQNLGQEHLEYIISEIKRNCKQQTFCDNVSISYEYVTRSIDEPMTLDDPQNLSMEHVRKLRDLGVILEFLSLLEEQEPKAREIKANILSKLISS